MSEFSSLASKVKTKSQVLSGTSSKAGIPTNIDAYNSIMGTYVSKGSKAGMPSNIQLYNTVYTSSNQAKTTSSGSSGSSGGTKAAASNLSRYNTEFYTVVKGDDLNLIATNYRKNGYAYVTVEHIMSMNSIIKDKNTICIGWKLRILNGAASSTETSPSLNTKIEGIGIITGPIVNGVDQADGKTLYVIWSCKRSHIDHFEVEWGDEIGTTNTYNWTSTTVPGDDNAKWTSTHSFPDRTNSVWFRIRAISQTYKSGDKDVKYWTDENWTISDRYLARDLPLEKPSTPNQSIDNGQLKVELNYTAAQNITAEFQVWIDDTDVYKTLTGVSTNTGVVNAVCTVDTGHSYKVRARVYTSETNMSAWSDFPESGLQTGPARIEKFTKCMAMAERGNTYAYFEWVYDKPATDARDITYEIQQALYLNAFTQSDEVETHNIPKNVTTWRIIIDPGYTYFFRIRAINESGEGPWSDISTITVGKKPAIPTTWSSTSTGIIGEDLNLYWVHNSEDNSSQSKAIFEYTIGDTTPRTIVLTDSGTTGQINLPNSSGVINWVFLDNNDGENPGASKIFAMDTTQIVKGVTMKWRIQTYGIDDAKPSDWSVMRTIRIYEAPSVELNISDEESGVIHSIYTITKFPFYISAKSGTTDQKPIGFSLSIAANESYNTLDLTGNALFIGAGQVIYSQFFDITTNILVELNPQDIDLQSGIKYNVTCTVSMDSGLSASEITSFDVVWEDATYYPNAYINYDPSTYQTSICPICEDEDGNLITNVWLSVYRKEFDGTFVPLGDLIPNNRCTYITDPHPPLDFARYRIIAIDNLTGALSYTDTTPYEIGEKSIIIQWAESWSDYAMLDAGYIAQPWSGSLVKLPYNIDVQDKTNLDVELINFVGRKSPVSYYGTQVGETANWSCEIPKKDIETIYALRRLAKYTGDVYVREPSGTGYWANINVSFGIKHLDLTIPVTFEITRVEAEV